MMFTAGQMKRTAAAAGLLFCCTNLVADIERETYRLNFDDEIATIEETSRAAKPLERTLSKGIRELRDAIARARENPHILNKSRFELKYARYLKDVVQDMDELTVHREQSVWAFEDIARKIREVEARLDLNHKRAAERSGRRKYALEKLQRELRDIARRVRSKGGEDAPDDARRELMTRYRRYKMGQRNLKNLRALEKQQAVILASLKKHRTRVAQINDNLASWFDTLNEIRDGFREMAETKADINEIRRLMHQPGIGSLSDTVQRLNKVMNKLQEFSDTIMAMGTEVGGMNDLEIPAFGSDNIEDVLAEVLDEDMDVSSVPAE